MTHAPIDGGLRAKFREKLPGHWQCVETGSIAQGVPDSNYCVHGSEGWVEFKQTRAWAVSFRPTQCGWIMRRTQEGGRVWVAVRRWHNVQRTDELWMVPGRYVLELEQHGLREVMANSYGTAGGPAQWNWTCVLRLLIS